MSPGKYVLRPSMTALAVRNWISSDIGSALSSSHRIGGIVATDRMCAEWSVIDGNTWRNAMGGLAANG